MNAIVLLKNLNDNHYEETIVKDIDADVTLLSGEKSHTEYHMSDLDIELIKEYAEINEKLYKKYSLYDSELLDFVGMCDEIKINTEFEFLDYFKKKNESFNFNKLLLLSTSKILMIFRNVITRNATDNNDPHKRAA